MTDITITGNARAALRSAITSHPKWSEYRKVSGKLVSEYSKEDYITACQALSLDIHAIIATETGKGDTMKDRPHDRAAVDALRAKYNLISDLLIAQDRDKADGIFESIRRYGGGMATDAQYKAVDKIVLATATATPPSPVTSTVTAPSSAGTAMWEIIKDAARADMDPMVRDLVGRALEGVQTIRIELTRQGETMGGTDGHQHPLFATLCRALAARQADGFAPNIWINGPAGSGKTYATRAFAKAAGLDYRFQGASMMPHEVLGFIDAAGTYHRTAFREAFEHGGVFTFDEADAWSNEALLPLNAATANGRMQFPDAMINRHPDCIIIATANTFGLGGVDYVGRNKIDMAFLSRFPVRLTWSYDVALEIAISGNPDFARRVQAARERARAAGLKVMINPRDSLAGAALIAQGFTHDWAASLTYLANLSPDQAKIVEGR